MHAQILVNSAMRNLKCSQIHGRLAPDPLIRGFAPRPMQIYMHCWQRHQTPRSTFGPTLKIVPTPLLLTASEQTEQRAT